MKPFLVAALISGLSVCGVLPARAVPSVCHAPEGTAGPIGPLPRVSVVLKPGGTLRILAVGSATMFGPGASLRAGTITSQALSNAASVAPPPKAPLRQEPTAHAFPRQMVDALEKEMPGLKVDLVVRGGRGMSAADMLTLLQSELGRVHPQLVLWQTGTVEAVRNTPPGDFAQTLETGAEAIEAAGANLILIDPQFSRFLQANSNLEPYLQALQQVTGLPGVLLFHRFDLMRSWAADGRLDLERAKRADRRTLIDEVHACIGQDLARMVFAAARS